jgi:mannose-6-phosphate isomerase-like protein (cupin superfamily)
VFWIGANACGGTSNVWKAAIRVAPVFWFGEDGAFLSTRKEETWMPAVNLAEKLSTFSDHWAPRVVTEFNGHDVMVVKVKGEFRWHQHDDTDDFFLVLSGRITIRMHEGDVSLGPGELFVVPKGMQHCPVAEEEAHPKRPRTHQLLQAEAGPNHIKC